MKTYSWHKFPSKSPLRKFYFSALLGATLPNAQGIHAEETKGMAHTGTIWQLVDSISKLVPFSKEKLEGVLGAELTDSSNTGNDVSRFLESKHAIQVGEVQIQSVDLRIRRTGNRWLSR